MNHSTYLHFIVSTGVAEAPGFNSAEGGEHVLLYHSQFDQNLDGASDVFN